MRRWLALALLVACGEQSSGYTPCPGGSAACKPSWTAYEQVCAVFKDASLCGPSCDRLGPCGDEAIMGTCLLNAWISETGLCLPTCTTADDCPDDGMECQACVSGETCVLGPGLGLGGSVCVWPD